jgi:hypothetical protein
MPNGALVFPMFVALLVVESGAFAQGPPGDAVGVLVDVRGYVERLDSRRPGEVWPGFEPAGIPVLYVLPGEGTMLLGWDGEPPAGFTAVDGVPEAGWRPEAQRGAASTAVNLGGRGVTKKDVDELEVASLIGITVHEAFHVFAGGVWAEGRRFGQGENSFLVTRYPIFSVENEAAFALEGRILAAALRSRTDAEARELAQAFIAVREGRQRRLDADLIDFEMQAELNEGLAQYAGVRGLLLLADAGDERLASELRAEAQDMQGDLDRLTESGDRSFRLRFYHTGPAVGLLLDRLADGDWKSHLVETNATLQDALARLSGYRDRENALRDKALGAFGAEALKASAVELIAALRDSLKSRVDRALSRPGVQVVILADGVGRIGLCGIDPQNLLQVDQGVLLHTRWLRPCAGSALEGEFNTPVVHDRNAGTMRAVIGEPQAVMVTVGGEVVALGGERSMNAARDVEVESPGLTLRCSRADVEIEGLVLRIRPLPD